MPNSEQQISLRSVVESTLRASSRSRSRRHAFPLVLENLFEAETRQARAGRMRFDGLVALAAFNVCLLLDFFTVKDSSLSTTFARTALATPIALVVNEIVRRNPPRWLREGSVAVGMLLICIINLFAEGHASTAATMFGAIGLLISALFVGIVMRLRFAYALPTLSAMLLSGLWSLAFAHGLRPSEANIGASMIVIGIAVILVASFSLESEERKSYLLGLQRDLQAGELAWANQSLKELSNIDELTRLPNRRALDERVAMVWKSCSKADESVAAIVVDVDYFKAVNDRYGHLFGDDTLRHIGTLLPRALRSSRDIVARFGGEEFVLLLPDADAAAAIAVAEQVRRLVEAAVVPPNALHPSDAPFRITVSCGVSTYRPSGLLQWNDLIVAADRALYQAKSRGRNRVAFHACGDPWDLPQRRVTDQVPARTRRIGRPLRPQTTAHIGVTPPVPRVEAA